MSKGTIIDHQGDGLYTVRLSYTREAIDAEALRIQSRLAELTALVPQKKNELSDAEASADSFVSQINALIPDYVADRDEHRSKLLELQRSSDLRSHTFFSIGELPEPIVNHYNSCNASSPIGQAYYGGVS